MTAAGDISDGEKFARNGFRCQKIANIMRYPGAIYRASFTDSTRYFGLIWWMHVHLLDC